MFHNFEFSILINNYQYGASVSPFYSLYNRYSMLIAIIGFNIGWAGGGAPSGMTLKGERYVWPPRFFGK